MTSSSINSLNFDSSNFNNLLKHTTASKREFQRVALGFFKYLTQHFFMASADLVDRPWVFQTA